MKEGFFELLERFSVLEIHKQKGWNVEDALEEVYEKIAKYKEPIVEIAQKLWEEI